MKWTTTALCGATATTAFVVSSTLTTVVSAFAPAALLIGRTTAPTTNRLFSTTAVAEETSNKTTPTSAADAQKKKKKNPTRFDRLKQTYKGPRFELPTASSHDDSDSSSTEKTAAIPFSYDDFSHAVANVEYAFERNSIVQGTAVEYSGDTGCLVDIGAKASAFLPAAEASLLTMGASSSFSQEDTSSVAGSSSSSSSTRSSSSSPQSLQDLIPLNVPMDFQIISDEDENGQLLVSVKRIQYKQAWDKVLELAAQDAVLEAPVVAVNRGGAICLVEGLRAFLPGSHLTGQLPDDDLIGQTLPLKFLEVNQETNKLVVSNRKAVVEQQMADLSRGDVVQGLVKALKPYGAFVEVGGMSGLLHISQISYDRIEDLEQVLQPGQQIKCMIIDHDKVNGRIALSTKTLEPQAGDMLKDPQMVFDKADETAVIYHARMEAERQAREAAARDIVLGLGDSLDDLNDDSDNDSSSILEGKAAAAASAEEEDDPLKDVSDSLDSLLS